MSNPEIPFFSAIPDAALPATQRLWDAIDVPGYNALTAYNAFVMDVKAVGLDAPPRTAVRRWAAGVEAGLIDRPVTGENKLRVKKTMETPPAPEVPEPSNETTHATIEAAAVTTAEKARKVGTLKLRRELLGNEVAALQTLKETLTTEILTESPPCKDFSAPSDETSTQHIWVDETQPIIGKAPAFEPVTDVIGTLRQADAANEEIVADPVQDAVDIIVKHYLDQEYAKVRSIAALKAAAALREFASRIEASA